MAGDVRGLSCPQCQALDQSRVVLSRRPPGGGVLRRHLCSCGHRFYSLQADAELLPNHRLQWCNGVPNVQPAP